MSDSFIQVPPDSTGKKILSVRREHVPFGTVLTSFIIDEIITGSISGATGTVVGIVFNRIDPTKGDLWLKDVTGTFVLNDLLQATGPTTRATVTTSSNSLESQSVNITDGNIIGRMATIDERGSLQTRFEDGSPQFDSFNRLRTSQPVILGDYTFLRDAQDSQWSENLSGTGSRTYSGNDSSVVLDTAGTASGALARMTTQKYHHYQPGVGHSILMTTVLGDSGKTNVRRRWGYMDDNDGCYFELDDTTLYVVLRSSVTGSVVETRIPQSSWNKDKLDGTGISDMTLDLTKNNIYTIDIQWLGGGTISFGIFRPDGVEIVVHVIENGNATDRAWSKTGTLPMRYEVENTGVAVSSSEIKATTAVVRTEGDFRPNKRHFSTVRSTNVSGTTTLKPIIGIRPKTLVGTQPNRVAIIPVRMSMYTSAEVTMIQLIKNPATLTGESWTSANTESGTEYEISATAITGGTVLDTWFCPVGAMTEHFDAFDYLGEYIRLDADGTTQDEYVLAAETVTGTSNIRGSLHWDEIA